MTEILSANKLLFVQIYLRWLKVGEYEEGIVLIVMVNSIQHSQ